MLPWAHVVKLCSSDTSETISMDSYREYGALSHIPIVEFGAESYSHRGVWSSESCPHGEFGAVSHVPIGEYGAVSHIPYGSVELWLISPEGSLELSYRNWYQDWGHCGVTNDLGSSPQWPKSRYQFLFHHDASKHIKSMQIRVCVSRKSLIKLLQISLYRKHGHRPLSKQLP